ncbi:MAG: histidine kinase, partial [Lachnospiraceae bacterium]|nr:histidine kinase [Lachnospiraceae bacterium]
MRLLNVLKNKWKKPLKSDGRRHDLHRVIWVSFTTTAVVITLIMGLSVYGRYMSQSQETVRRDNQTLLTQVNYQFTSYLRSAMKVSDSLYYSVIKESELGQKSFSEAFRLLYDTNKDTIERIALFSESGELLEVAPAAKRKETVSLFDQEWYWETVSKEENITFGMPEVERLFEGSAEEYVRVIPMSRVVQLNRGDETEKGILLIQLKQSGISDILSNIVMSGDSYLYLTNAEGGIIYHPNQELVASGYLQEETIDLNKSEDSRFLKTGDDGEYYIKTVGYTGWKIVGVVQNEGISLNNFKSGLLIAFLVLFFLSVIAIVNMHLSKRLSAPMKRLEEAVNKIEAGDLDTHIEPSGFYEVWHLGRAISDMQANLKQLMDDIVAEHEAKRRSELMVLQNQINPHFLYNTLDIIVWMIENEKREEAVDVVTALARFFRISLSNGKTAISVMDEVEHVRNYLMIQEMRYKNKFTYTFDVEDGLEKYGTIKLILQPVVENCIYHAMEFMDGDGEIRITVKKDG